MRIAIRIGLGLLVAIAALAAGAVAFTWQGDRTVAALAPRWAPEPSRFLDLQGMRVHYRDQGPRDDPMPIVLLHGTSSSLHTWEGWVAALSGTRRVITMDLPAFGLTGPSPDGDYTIEAYVRFVRGFLDTVGVKRCVLGGNSLGGNIAWEVALADPPRVERLILVDAAGYAFRSASIPIGFRVARMPVVNRLMEYTLPRGLVEASVRNVFGDPSKVTPGLVDRYFELTLREGNRAALVRRFEQTRMGEHASLIAGIKVPTLILWGGQDRLIPPSDADSFHRDIAGSALAIFPELGHVPHEEDPVRTVAAVKAFFGP